MNAIQNALKIAAQKQIEYRNQTNIASRDALLVWEAQLSGLMESIEEWIQPLYDLDGFITEAKTSAYLVTDSRVGKRNEKVARCVCRSPTHRY